jgi:hypothetical protein
MVFCSTDFRPWRQRWYVLPKRRFTYELHGYISQKWQHSFVFLLPEAIRANKNTVTSVAMSTETRSYHQMVLVHCSANSGIQSNEDKLEVILRGLGALTDASHLSIYSVEWVRPQSWTGYKKNKTAKLVPTFADRGVLRSQRDGSLQPYSRLSRPEPLLFLSSSSSFVLTRLSGPTN